MDSYETFTESTRQEEGDESILEGQTETTPSTEETN